MSWIGVAPTRSAGLGFDYLVTDNIVVGLAATYETTDIKMQSALGKFDRDGWTVGPYVAIRERVSWTAKSGRRTQTALGVYEVRDGRVRRVWYYPAVRD